MADRFKRGMTSPVRLLVRALPTRTSRIVGALLAATASALCVIPGFNVLNYYSGLAIAVVGGLLVGLTNASDPIQPTRARLRTIILGRLAQALFLACIPLVILLLNAFRVTNCDLMAGLSFYAVGPLATILIASQWGLAARLLGQTRQRSILAFLGLWLAWIGSDVISFLTEPPIFAYNAFVGFFSGAVYDDLIRIDPPLLFFRLGNLVQLGLLLAVVSPLFVAHRAAIELSRLRTVRPLQWAVAGVAVLCVGTLTGAAGYLGYDIDRETIQAQLGGTLSNDQIVLFYDQSTITPEEAALILEDQTFRLHQLQPHGRGTGCGPT